MFICVQCVNHIISMRSLGVSVLAVNDLHILLYSTFLFAVCLFVCMHFNAMADSSVEFNSIFFVFAKRRQGNGQRHQ